MPLNQFIAYCALLLVAIGFCLTYVTAVRRINRRYPPLLGIIKDPFTKWRLRQRINYHLGSVAKSIYRTQTHTGWWVIGWFASATGTFALILGSPFINGVGFVFPGLMALCSLGVPVALRSQLISESQAWVALVEQQPDTAAALGIEATQLPQMHTRIQKLLPTYWLLAVTLLAVTGAAFILLANQY